MSDLTGCIPCQEDDFNPECGGTTRSLTVTPCVCTVLSENETVTMKCNPLLTWLPKFNAKVCGCPTKEVEFVIESLPNADNGIVYLTNTPVAVGDEITLQQNGTLYFKRIKNEPFTDTLTFTPTASCGEGNVYTVTFKALCTCVEPDPCETSDCGCE